MQPLPSAGDAISAESTTFADLKLNPNLLKAIEQSGYTSPTPVQERAIPAALSGNDLLVSAQTGTGKTAAFVLPILEKFATPAREVEGGKCRGPRALILTPTRELAVQITKAALNYGRYPKQVAIANIVGGMPYFRQRKQMSGWVDVMVATPGRLMDFMEQGEIDFRRLEFLVLDEADRMLDMGFRDAVFEIEKALPKERQTLLFSATIDKTVTDLARKILKDPVRIEVAAQRVKHEQIDEFLHYVSDLHGKRSLLKHLLKESGVEKTLIFAATKRSADELAEGLVRNGFATEALHGDMRQSARNRTVARLRAGEVSVVVATDVAARGLDVQGISHVINFDLPRLSEDYTHRIGRTGRAGAKGVAISFAYPSERGQVRRIETAVGHQIKTMVVPGFEVAMGNSDDRSSRSHPGRRFSENRGRSEGFRKRSDTADRGSRFARPERSESSGRSERSSFSERLDRSRSETIDRPPASDRSERSPRAERSDRPQRAAKSNFERRDSDRPHTNRSANRTGSKRPNSDSRHSDRPAFRKSSFEKPASERTGRERPVKDTATRNSAAPAAGKPRKEGAFQPRYGTQKPKSNEGGNFAPRGKRASRAQRKDRSDRKDRGPTSAR